MHAHMQYAFARVSGIGRRVNPRNIVAYSAGGNYYTTRCRTAHPSPKLTYGSVGSTTHSEIIRDYIMTPTNVVNKNKMQPDSKITDGETMKSLQNAGS